MARIIHSVADLVTGTSAIGHRPMFRTDDGWSTLKDGAVDLRSYGDCPGDGTDITAIVLDAIDDLGSATGSLYSTAGARALYVPPGVHGISDDCDFTGVWLSVIASGPAITTFKALHADARLSFFNSWGVISGFAFDGNDLATVGVHIRDSNGAQFRDIHVTNCAGNGVETHNLQNSTLIGVHSTRNTGHGIVVNNGTGSCVFIACHSNDNAGHQWYVTDDDTVASGYLQPTANQIIGGIAEHVVPAENGNNATSGGASTLTRTGAAWAVNQWAGAWVTKDPGGANQQGAKILSNTSDTLTIDGTWSVNPTTDAYRIHYAPVKIDASSNTLFQGFVISPGTAGSYPPGEFPLWEVTRRGLTEGIAEAILRHCILLGSQSYHIGFEVDGQVARLNCDPFTDLSGAKIGLRLHNESGTRIEGSVPTMASVTTAFAGVGGATLNSFGLNNRNYTQNVNTFAATTDRVEYNVLPGESGFRSVRYADGRIGWNDGSDFSEDTNLYRNAANELKTDDKFVIGTGVGVLRLDPIALPATCTVGELCVDTADKELKLCTATNTWTTVGSQT